MKKEVPGFWSSGRFWLFQLSGFAVLIIANSLILWGAREFDKTVFLGFLNNFGFLFLIVTAMRYLYRPVYRRTKNPGYLFFIAMVCSLIGAFLWVETISLGQFYFLKTSDVINFRGTQHSLAASVVSSAWAPFFWSILYFGIKYWKDLVTERQRSQSAIQLAREAQLQMLRYQMNPHFLFNSLNSIQALVHEDPDKADTMVSELSEFLRYTLNFDDRLMVKVREEMDITMKYLNIEKIRFEERLGFSISVQKEVLDMEIPCFISQPLVENSIKHGLTNNPGGIRLNFSIFMDAGSLVIEVKNNGSLSESWKMGLGLQNVMARLENCFPGRCALEISSKSQLVVARITIKQTHEKVKNINSR
jgi:hypothetical protein